MSQKSGASLRDGNLTGSHGGNCDAERRTTITRSQEFAERAFQRVLARQSGSPMDRDEFASFAKRFPSLIHSCGLAQAVAFAQAKAPDHFLDDLRAAMNSGDSNVTEFAEKVRSADVTQYLRLSRHALEAAGWLKRYAEALLED
jgi:CRISPR-associated protein Cmr5